MRAARTFSSSLFDLLYPRRCGLCGLLGDHAICSVCGDAFEPLSSPLTRFLRPEPLDYQAALYLYEGRAAQAVRRLKYERITSLAAPLAALIADGAAKLGLDSADMIVPVPIHWTRRCMRGFNQAEMLVERLPPELVASKALLRIKATRPQVGLSPDERRLNLLGAFAADSSVEGRRVLLVDDVVTSGQTARECARALRARGAAEVGVLALCGEA
jgi:competence protein ComFC